MYLLEPAYRDGTTHVVFDPPDFIARLAALVPRPRVNLTRHHGVLAPNLCWRRAGRIGFGRRVALSFLFHALKGVEMAVESKDLFVDVPGGQVFIRQWTIDGRSGAPIILLHDSLGSAEQWRSFPQALAAKTNRNVIAYDRLGFGRSTGRTSPAKADFIDEEAQVYLPAIVAALSLSHYILFGHSVGGGMALVAAATPGNHCAAVITESAQAFVEERTLSGIRDAKSAFENEAQFSRLAKWHGERAKWVLAAWTGVWLAPAFREWSLDPYLGKVHCPVLAMHGDSDEFGSCEFPRRITQGMRGQARMEIITPCGHVPHRGRESDVLALVPGFLAENRIA